GRTARGVRHVNGAIRRDLDVTMDTTGALRRGKEENGWAKGLASVIAARALRFRGNILGAIVDPILGPGSGIGSGGWRRSKVRTAAERLVIRTRARVARSTRHINVAIVII